MFADLRVFPGPGFPEVLSLEDGAWLMRAFWDASSPDFARPEALNYGKAGHGRELFEMHTCLAP